MTLGCTIQVVTTKDLVNFRAIKDHSNIAAYEGFNSIHLRLCFNAMFWVSRNSSSILSAQTATKHITINRTGIEVDIRCLVSIEYKVTGRLTGIHASKCTTAIHMAVHVSTARSLTLGSDVHLHRAFYQCRLTKTTTKDHIRYGVTTCRYRSHRTASNRHRGIAFYHTVHIGTAIDGSLHEGVGIGTIFDIHRGITKVLCYDIIGIIRIVVTQTATKYATIHSTFIDIDRRSLVI